MTRSNRTQFPGRALSLLGLGALALALRGDSCITEDRVVDAVVTATVPIVWHTEGTHTSGNETISANIAGEVDQAIEEFSGDVTVKKIQLSGILYEVVDNAGVVGAHQGTVTIESPGQSPLTILAYTVPNPPGNMAGATGGSGIDIMLQSAGLTFLNGRLAAYLADPANDALLDFTFKTAWTSTDPAPGHYDFHWQTSLILQIVGELQVTVPNP